MSAKETLDVTISYQAKKGSLGVDIEATLKIGAGLCYYYTVATWSVANGLIMTHTPGASNDRGWQSEENMRKAAIMSAVMTLVDKDHLAHLAMRFWVANQ